jgi:hypothetical protein
VEQGDRVKTLQPYGPKTLSLSLCTEYREK